MGKCYQYVSYKIFADMWFDACDEEDRSLFMNRWLDPRLWKIDYELVYGLCDEVWRLAHLDISGILEEVTPSQVCRELCIPRSTLMGWKSGKHKPPDWARLWIIRHYKLENFDRWIRIGDVRVKRPKELSDLLSRM